ncbi:MAG: hypothetical protein H6850_03190 [Alphaproteobacteria bacterium]|nr:MAG: hypothetical protein H6850_03190 [Alphaproteobacteria bacterium]
MAALKTEHFIAKISGELTEKLFKPLTKDTRRIGLMQGSEASPVDFCDYTVNVMPDNSLTYLRGSLRIVYFTTALDNISEWVTALKTDARPLLNTNERIYFQDTQKIVFNKTDTQGSFAEVRVPKNSSEYEIMKLRLPSELKIQDLPEYLKLMLLETGVAWAPLYLTQESLGKGIFGRFRLAFDVVSL